MQRLEVSCAVRDIYNVSRLRVKLWNQIRHCKTVCIKINLYLINYNRMRTQRTAKGNRDAGSPCSCDRGLHRYLRNFGGEGVEPPKQPLSVRHCFTQTSTWQHTTLTTDKHQCPPGGIQTQDLSRRAAEDLHLSPHGHWDRMVMSFRPYGSHNTR